MNQHGTQSNSSESLLFSPGLQIQGDVTLTQELINITDEFNEFVCVNAFIGESIVALVSEQEVCTPEIARGAKYCVEAIQSRSMHLKEALGLCCQRHLAEVNVQLPKDGN